MVAGSWVWTVLGSGGMKDRVSTVRMRELGAALRKAKEGAGLEGSSVQIGRASCRERV
mgnify:CR=1 FL=1